MAIPRESIVLTSPLLTALRSDIVQVLAIDARHLLRVRRVQPSDNPQKTAKTYLECFTRRGQFMGQLSVNLPIIHMTPTAVPYQFMALIAEGAANAISAHSAASAVVLVTLKPFQVRPLQVALNPEQMSAFSWGCILTSEQGALLLDRSAEPMGWLKGLPMVDAITAVGDRQLLMTVPSTKAVTDRTPLFKQNSTRNRPLASREHSLANGLSSLLLLDFTQLELDLIF